MSDADITNALARCGLAIDEAESLLEREGLTAHRVVREAQLALAESDSAIQQLERYRQNGLPRPWVVDSIRDRRPTPATGTYQRSCPSCGTPRLWVTSRVLPPRGSSD